MAASPRPSIRPAILVILDGFGSREPAPDNAITRAVKPNWDHLVATCRHTTIAASERFVGLPTGLLGNSVVGHLNIGAGRVVYQVHCIDRRRDGRRGKRRVDGSDRRKDARWGAARVQAARRASGHERQIAAMVELAATGGARVLVHASTGATPRRKALRHRSRSSAKSARGIPVRASLRSSAAITRWTATSAGSASASRTISSPTDTLRSPRVHRRPDSTRPTPEAN
jgi:2,3-bisphosphoglycerate-independent phosphoglycerate mutase